MPTPDLPFDAEYLDFARKALKLAGLEPDRDWLAVRPVDLNVLDLISEVRFHYQQAREAVPRSTADWEQAQFMAVAIRAALWDLRMGPIRTFAEFEFLYRRILGEEAVPYLPQLFAAAACSPALCADVSNTLMRTLPEREEY